MLEPEINVPDDTEQITISKDGTVFAKLSGTTDPVELGQIELATFINRAGLEQAGGNLFMETAASGGPIEGFATEGQFGRILQRSLEASNVNPVTELIGLIKTQRAFEMNSQSIQAADEALQVISNLRRF